IMFAVPVIYVASPASSPARCGLFPCLGPQASYQSITRHLLGVGGQIPADFTRYDFFWRQSLFHRASGFKDGVNLVLLIFRRYRFRPKLELISSSSNASDQQPVD